VPSRDKLGDPCRSCKWLIPPGTHRCPNPKCGEWNFASSDEKEVDVVRLSDARVSIVPRLSTLHPAMDKFFGGGLVESSTCLLAAPPGFGKTTCFLQLADHISRVTGNRDVAYVANEQAASEIRAKAIELGIRNMHQMCVIPMMGGFRGSLFEVITRLKPCLIIVDSLTKLVGRDPEFAVIVASEMKGLSVDLKAPTLLVNQVTKELDHAGLEKLQHEVDMTALGHMEGTKRFLQSEKNRNGPAPLILAMEMRSEEDFAQGRGGLEVLGLVTDDEEDEEGAQAPDKKERPVATIGDDDPDAPGIKRLKA
jgi:predicted ATP-dependent serine protease